MSQTIFFHFHITFDFFSPHEKSFCNTVISFFNPFISRTPALQPSVLFSNSICSQQPPLWGQGTRVPLSFHSLLLCLGPGFSLCHPSGTPTHTKKEKSWTISGCWCHLQYFRDCPIIRTVLPCDWSCPSKMDQWLPWDPGRNTWHPSPTLKMSSVEAMTSVVIWARQAGNAPVFLCKWIQEVFIQIFVVFQGGTGKNSPSSRKSLS